jgi:hypothetical protein
MMVDCDDNCPAFVKDDVVCKRSFMKNKNSAKNAGQLALACKRMRKDWKKS